MSLTGLISRLLGKEERTEDEDCEEAAKVESMWIYPVKSCRGISVSEAPICSTGFLWDRLWMVVNSGGRACTQRVEPSLALVEVELPRDAFCEGWEPKNGSFLEIRAPGMDALKVPLIEPSTVSDGISVWDWSGSALDEGDEAAEWFTKYLGKPSRLVRFHEASQTRAADPNYAAGHKIKFNDAYPIHLASQKSLDVLNEQLKEPVSMNRFRPNILVDGCEPYAEDFWKEIKINGLTFNSAQLCYRCKIPRVNQETAEVGDEPTETLTKFRSSENLHPDKKPHGRVYFGQTFVCNDWDARGKPKTLKVGDPVYVLKMVSSYVDVSV
ncbi:mitochondrial amidoxime reducing component 2-like [Ipomoea triloba]|uniref:mitochondrial amidoxime reducing component 2-like n=1 Tax=Ipomoea triloba TaxID=35885 RepID=UPI00125E648C|nr:mitochondrial amidoxime reducing component 2-like [Ipomoea triloba]